LSKAKKPTAVISKKEIKDVLPFRGPFLLIDEVLEYEEGIKVVAAKRLTGREVYLRGHFPGYPVMPGHLMAEAMVQACALFFKKQHHSDKKMAYFLTSSKVRFLGQVRPKDRIIVTARPVKLISFAGIFECEAKVGQKRVAKGQFGVAAKEVQR